MNDITAMLLHITLGTLLMTILAVTGGFILQGIDRKLAALMQARIGPPLIQPYWDFKKLLCKENIVPEHAIPWLFNAAPLVAFATAVTVMLYIPIAGFKPLLSGYGDLILVMYLLAIPALAMVAGGFASGSPYASLGAQREMVMMIAYELPLGAAIISFAWKLAEAGVDHPFALQSIIENPIWGMVGPFGAMGACMLLLAMVMVTPGELSKVPFDAPEAKSELADGLLVEYSGRNLAMYYLTLGTKMVVMASLIIAMFVPYNISPLFNLSAQNGTGLHIAANIIDIIFFMIKVLLVMFISMTLIRTAMARFRINQIMTMYWKYGGIMTLLGLILIMLDARL